ncbi:MAG: tRNA (adenosine(37)-N6)-threonylcarbamoyltransferase complex dimerization subunit type 1 TsaB [Lachnospiraceae bacterium]|nr:tRNA (adenosine(37)-N6)-threonylcarbamoyltransferase complex dimerization subunit type 1 TsaB [Lachnospiraceae bacterium]MBR4795636.1 tRNA (adenosine(37)-N6)-threonylcarbamoyltransferase complex dimerization subunit type 1 TsaB [Lachnospiraceae bacterium]
MKILGIESSGLTASIAVLSDDVIIAEYTTNFKKTHSETLLPMIAEVMDRIGIDINEIDYIAISEGPGSFTGLRIGAATAKGLGLATGKELVSVPTVKALCYNLYNVKGVICPIMDAKREQVYTGIFEYEGDELKTLFDTDAIPVTEIIGKLNEIGKEVTFLGDGVPVYKDIIKDSIKVPYHYAPANLARQSAASVCVLAADMIKEGKTVDAAMMRPEYLRLSQAERERNERMGQNI